MKKGAAVPPGAALFKTAWEVNSFPYVAIRHLGQLVGLRELKAT
jgi:hypothetical protein